MFSSTALEVGIGLIFVFLIFSLILTATAEMIETFFRNRAVFLQRALAELLGNDEVRKELMGHGMLFGLYQGDTKVPTDADLKEWRLRRDVQNLPSYIPKESFAKALIDLHYDANGDATLSKATPSESFSKAFSAIRRQAGGDPALLQAEVERWYDATMERATGWFKRRTQWILFGIGLVAAIALNINAVAITRHLESRPEARAAVIVAAAAAAEAGANVPAATPEAISAELDRLTAATLPIGWPGTNCLEDAKTSAGGWAPLVFGWLIMAAAGTLGGPFWFDVLNKVMQVRSALKPIDGPPGQASAGTRAGPVVDDSGPQAHSHVDPSTVGGQ